MIRSVGSVRLRYSTWLPASTWPKFSLEFYAQNVFDKRNDLSRYVACASCTRVLVVPGTPRTVGLRAGYKF